MQYLSKAYNYYSGINPATLSGAIDVIVVRCVDASGEVTLSSSPFHVRFGKLQVLRAAEKRVVIKMPNNLPAPHIVPFGMKVGESGEAFFVLETTESVPEELLTSPVVMPTDSEDTPSAPTPPSNARRENLVTKEPFGETEKLANRDHLDDVEFLDLNEPGSPSKIETSYPPPTSQSQPPNPMEASPGESAALPSRDYKLEEVGALPKVEPGQADGPSVVYGKDVVLDISGYHNEPQEALESHQPQSSLIDGLTRDLLAAINDISRPPLAHSPSDPLLHDTPLEVDSDSASAFELSPRRFDRGQSEPPPEFERAPRRMGTIGPLSGASSAAVMDYAWDWGKVPRPPAHPDDVDEYALPESLDLAGTSKLGHVDSYIFTLTASSGRHYAFELGLCGSRDFAKDGRAKPEEEAAFLRSRVTFEKFLEDPDVVDDPNLVLRYSLSYYTWNTASDLLRALAMYRRSLSPQKPERPVSGSSWSWWKKKEQEVPKVEPQAPTQYAKTLRLSSDQLKQLHLQPGPNTVHFSVTSSYSGLATCTARIFLWEDTDQIVISDIDGTITKSDALGHVFAAIGRDWTHLGIARLYTDVCNNGYKMMYLTSRAIGQADSTREYLKSITQGEYRLPEGPVIMSPDRLIASLHREVIMRKPELFKMACLRDIQRLFGPKANEAFFAGFGNRITDAMSYRSVGVPTSKIYTIDSTGVVKTELLQAAGHKGSYVALNDLVNEVFPPVTTKFKPEYTDFNYWRADIADIALPDLSPPSPALSARSDSSRYSVLGKFIGRRSSRQPVSPGPGTRPSSPLMGPATTAEDGGSMPGSFDSRGEYMRGSGESPGSGDRGEEEKEERKDDEEDDDDDESDVDLDRNDSFDDDAIFDDDILAAGEMKNVPF